MITEEYSKYIYLLKNEIDGIKRQNFIRGVVFFICFGFITYILFFAAFIKEDILVLLIFYSPFFLLYFLAYGIRKKLKFVSLEKSDKYELYTKCVKLAKVFNCIAELNPSCNTGYAILKNYSNDKYLFENIVDSIVDSNYKKYGWAGLILLAMSRTKADISELDSFARSDVKDRLRLLNGLFILAIAEDGIKLDEWQFLLAAIKRLKLNKFYTADYIKRFAPLRTEWTAEEQEEIRKENERREQQRRAYRESESSDSQKPLLHQYYLELGLDDNASYEEVRKAYHALAMQHHPDLPKNADRQQECQDLMVKINLAYSKIMDR